MNGKRERKKKRLAVAAAAVLLLQASAAGCAYAQEIIVCETDIWTQSETVLYIEDKGTAGNMQRTVTSDEIFVDAEAENPESMQEKSGDVGMDCENNAAGRMQRTVTADEMLAAAEVGNPESMQEKSGDAEVVPGSDAAEQPGIEIEAVEELPESARLGAAIDPKSGVQNGTAWPEDGTQTGIGSAEGSADAEGSGANGGAEGSGVPGESETESETESESETKPPLDEPESEPETQQETEAEKVYLGIDNLHLYEGMEQTFSDGYEPEIRDGVLYLTVPFTASGALKGDRLTVGLAFADKENMPFVFKNYQKDVAKRRYQMTDGRMTETAGSTNGSAAGQNAAGTTNGFAAGQNTTGTASGFATGQNAAGTTNNPAAGQNTAGTTNGSAAEQNGGSGAPQNPGVQETYLYQCQIPLQENAAPGQYSITVEAWGCTLPGERTELSCQVFVRIPEPPEEKTQEEGTSGGGYSGGGGSIGGGGGGEAAEEIIRQPKLLLDDCSLTGEVLEAGSRETLKATFCNRSETQAAYNVKVTLSTEQAAVQPLKNSWYFAKVAPGEEIALDGVLAVPQNAEGGTVPLSFDFEYEDRKGTAATGKETVALTVEQPVRMELEAEELPAVLYATDTVELPLRALNLSRTNIYNARIHLSGTGLFPVEDVFIGNMEAGTEGSGNMRIYVGTRTMEAIGEDTGTQEQEKYGAVDGTITLQYEDAAGQTHEETQTYQAEIKKPKVLSLQVEEEKPEKNAWWISVFAVAFLGMFALIVLLLVRLRRKNVLLEEARLP